MCQHGLWRHRRSRGARCARCAARHAHERDQRRGSPAARGYDAEHRDRFRAGVLARDVTCVLCGRSPAQVADHYPVPRRELVRRGLDANDPAHGRGLCHPCNRSHGGFYRGGQPSFRSERQTTLSQVRPDASTTVELGTHHVDRVKIN